MSDLIDDPLPGRNLPEYTVSEISGEVKRTLEGAFGRIRVRGEVGRVFRARSGHLYFDIKDERNVLACTTWKGQIAGLSVLPEEGLEVIVTGRMSAFGGQSKYNLNVDEVAIAGRGALMALLEKRKKQLAAEGLFDPARKKKLPFLPRVIGVITSPSGAVIRDILHRLRDRFPRRVLIWPVAVQGRDCAGEVARAIEGFNRLDPEGPLPRPDLIIVARGGGSVEDLWGFNEEIVARAAAASRIPLIAAVGHETDTTLIDYAADRRAPTPTAAAEMAVPVRLELISWCDDMGARLRRAATEAIARRRQRLTDLARALPRTDSLLEGPRQRLDRAAEALPNALIRAIQTRRLQLSELAGSLRPATLQRMTAQERRRLQNLSARLSPALTRYTATRRERLHGLGQRLVAIRPDRDIRRRREDLDRLEHRLATATRTGLERRRQQLKATDRLRETLSYKATLARGYAVVRADGKVVTSRTAAARARALDIEFRDGRLAVVPKPGGRRHRTDPKPEQGKLF